MSHFTTPLGQQLANPGTGEPFSTAVVNGDLIILENGVIADRARLTTIEGWSAGRPGANGFADYKVADLAALAATSATAGDTARVTALGGCVFRCTGTTNWVQEGVAQVATANARDTEYAKASGAYLTPQARALAADTGIVWGYFTLYNSGTNPMGAKAAGWYPVPGGIMPGGLQVRSAAAQVLTATGYTLLPAAFFSETLAGASRQQGLSTPFATNGGFKVDVDGLYDVSLFLRLAVASGIINIKKNDATASDTGSVLGGLYSSISGDAKASLAGRVALLAGDILRVSIFSSGAPTITANPVDALFGLRYVEPIRA